MATPFLLSHHPPSGYDRCVRVGGLHLCARCLGLYPTMFAALAVQIALRSPMAWPGDPWLAFLLPVPALVDWARGKFDPRSGTNASRLLTGTLLGISLGRTLYLHLRKPGFPLTMAQLGVLTAAFLGVEVASRLRRKRSDPNRPPDVPNGDRDGSGP